MFSMAMIAEKKSKYSKLIESMNGMEIAIIEHHLLIIRYEFNGIDLSSYDSKQHDHRSSIDKQQSRCSLHSSNKRKSMINTHAILQSQHSIATFTSVGIINLFCLYTSIILFSTNHYL